MARHDQQVTKANMTCPNCKQGACEVCVDALRTKYTDEPICTCGRQGHASKRDGEGVIQQVRDPFTGAISAPGLTVSEDGQVDFDDDRTGSVLSSITPDRVNLPVGRCLHAASVPCGLEIRGCQRRRRESGSSIQA